MFEGGLELGDWRSWEGRGEGGLEGAGGGTRRNLTVFVVLPHAPPVAVVQLAAGDVDQE